jgi:hypothetical protein
VRRHWLGGVWRNPLARSADRWQAGLRIVLVTLWILALPLAATVSSLQVANGLQAIDQAAGEHTKTSAVLLAASPAVIAYSDGISSSVPVGVQASWVAPDGTSRSGQVTAPSGLPVGAKVEIWTDRTGTPIPTPERPSGAVGTGILVGAGLWLGWGLVLAVVFRLSVLSLDRGRRAQWDRDWLKLAPH